LRLREFIVERITVIKFGLNDRGSNDTDSRQLTNRGKTGYSEVDACDSDGFGDRCNLVRGGKMFVKDKANISCRVGGVRRQ